jgi:ectoine hydroxylase
MHSSTQQRVRTAIVSSTWVSDPYASRTGAQLTQDERIVDRIDPVVYSPQDARSPIGRELVDHFDRNGFIEISSPFAIAELRLLQNELTRLRSDRTGIDPSTMISEPGGDELRSIFRIHRQSALIQRLARDARLVDIARYLLGDEVYIHQSRLNYKPGFFGKEFYWHSDFETWHVEDGMPRMRALSMSISLTENTHFNGPLMVMPKSHRRYVRCLGETPEDHYKQSLRKQEYGVPDPESLSRLYAEGGIVAPTGMAGKIVIFDCNAMHGSNGNISPLPRSNVFMVYNAMSNRLQAPFGGMRPRPEFIAAREDIEAVEPVRGALAA